MVSSENQWTIGIGTFIINTCYYKLKLNVIHSSLNVRTGRNSLIFTTFSLCCV